MFLTGSPEWFQEKSKTPEIEKLVTEMEGRRRKFIDLFSPEALNAMNGQTLLQNVFGDNSDSMMQYLMFDKNYRGFGAPGRYKYLSVVYQENGTVWKYKEGAYAEKLTFEEAVEKAECVRDQLVFCINEIKNTGLFSTISDYQDFENRVEKVFFYKYGWALKYYQMLYPQFFPQMYSDKTIERALIILGLPNHGKADRILNIGEISLFIRRCDISSFVFDTIYGKEWGWHTEATPCENAVENYKNSSLPVLTVNTEYYESYNNQGREDAAAGKEIISFASGKTYDLVRETHIHAHPVKRGFPTSASEYLMVRGTGGISHELFKVKTVLEFNPEDTEYLHSLASAAYYDRLEQYIRTRETEFGFSNAPSPYRFYVLEAVFHFDPPYKLEPNIQGYTYFSFEQLGLTREEIFTGAIERLEADLDTLDASGEEKLALVKTRINQGLFRERLLKRYGKCCLCNVSCPDMLIASHIKPWAASERKERVDEDNGFLFCPNHDRLFDKGFISFDDDGNILISSQLGETDRVFMNVQPGMKIELSEGNRKYLEYHREKVFRK